jgi:hypothetical protein
MLIVVTTVVGKRFRIYMFNDVKENCVLLCFTY